jgi:2-polyprenyl-3-methyl-5-hydroxy-6-metoxy-1,4-benzoquinol methylase
VKKYIDIKLDKLHLPEFLKDEINILLNNQNPLLNDELEQMWHLLDLVWDKFNCNNEILNWDNISKYYSHPVWLLNGLFIEQHPTSIEHRKIITQWISSNHFNSILDYGGGFGTLAIFISKNTAANEIDIYEPHPSEFGLKRLKQYKNINIVDKIEKQYDCLISTDVLEHIENPLEVLLKMIKCVKVNGYLIIANCFKPVIKCHLPKTFDLEYTFNIFSIFFGLEIVEELENTHATIYKKSIDKEISNSELIQLKKESERLYNKIQNSDVNNKKTKKLLLNKSLYKLFNSLEEFRSTKEKYIIYGAGTGATLITSYLKDKIEFIVDMNITTKTLNDISIYSLDMLKQTSNKIIISVFGREKEIIKTLIDIYKIDKNRLIILDL